MARTDARARGGAGLFNVISVVILVVGVLIIGITAALLARTLAAAQSIDKKAQAIAGNAGQVNVSTNSVVDLNRTNELSASILQSAKPLQGQLNTVDATARDIAGLAKSINETAEPSTPRPASSTARPAPSATPPGTSPPPSEPTAPRRARDHGISGTVLEGQGNHRTAQAHWPLPSCG